MPKNKIYNNKGITLISLAITIVVLIILASVSTYVGVNSLNQSKENTQLSELGIVQQVILENYTKYELTGNEQYLAGTKITDYSEMKKIEKEINDKIKDDITLKITAETYDGIKGQEAEGAQKEYYYYELDQSDLKKIGITQESEKYIVNYATGEVINKDVLVTKSGKPLYTYSVDTK